MGKTVLVLLILCFVASGAAFERPWNNYSWLAENQNIYYVLGFEVWLNTDGFHGGLQTLDYKMLEDEGDELSDKIEALSNLTSKEDYEHGRCKGSINFLNMSDPEAQTLLLMTGLGGIPGITISSALQAYAGSETVKHCFYEYPVAWKNAVAEMLEIVEWSEKKAEESVDDARDAYEKLKFSGVCGSGYVGPGSENCLVLEAAFIGIGSPEGVYHESLMGIYHDDFQSEISKQLPTFQLFYNEMVLIWGDNGTISKYEAHETEANDAMVRADIYYAELHDNATCRRKDVKNKVDDLENEELEKIISGLGSHELNTFGTIAGRLEDLEEKIEGAEVYYEYSKKEFYRITEQDYLKNAIEGMEYAYNIYYETEIGLDYLRSDADDVVEEQRRGAEEALEDAKEYINEEPRSTESVTYYQYAIGEFSEGENAKKLGEKFKHYYDAAAYARMCMDERSFQEEFDVGGKISEIEDLINRADEDGIETFTETEILGLLKKQSNIPGVIGILGEIEEGIISKAKGMYGEELDERRGRVLSKIELAGSVAADLVTSMDNAERDIVENGEINYPRAIGNLKNLLDDYIEIEEYVDFHIRNVLAGAMEKEGSVFISEVELDKEAILTLDVVLSNPTPYNGSNIEVPVHLGRPIQFLFSDITEGEEYVNSIRSEYSGETLMVVLKEAQPYENYFISFEKNAVVAHIENAEKAAVGTGNGQAYIEDKIEFELDVGIDGLVLEEEFYGGKIDGLDPDRPLEKGKHILTASYVLDDAYNESVGNITVSPLGINSRIEYCITFLPMVDLDSTIFFVETTEGVYTADIQLYSSGGQKISKLKEVTERTFGAEVYNLKAGQETDVFVSYIVYNVSDILEEEIALIENQYNLSDDVLDYIDDAKNALANAEYPNALEDIENAKKLIKEETKKKDKLTKKIEEKERKLSWELEELNEALYDAVSENMGESFVALLENRIDELGRIIEESEGEEDLEQRLLLLENVDMKWLEKTIKNFKKESLKTYADLKERLAESGDLSTPPKFLELEEKLRKLEAGGRIEYTLEVMRAVSAAEGYVLGKENEKEESDDALAARFEELKEETFDVLNSYLIESSAAKGTEYSSYFKITEKRVNEKVDDAEKALKKGKLQTAESKLSALNKTKEEMYNLLEQLKSESELKLKLAKNIYLANKEEMVEEKQDKIEDKTDTIEIMIAAGNYVNALRATSALIEEIESRDGGPNMILLSVTAIAILAAVVAYIIKQQREKPGKKELKTLKKISK